MKVHCPLEKQCNNCVQEKVEEFNKKYRAYPNGKKIDSRNITSIFLDLTKDIHTCKNILDNWKNNGTNSDIKKGLRKLVASVIIHLLKQKPLQPITPEIDENIIQLKQKNSNLLRPVAQILNIELQKLKKLIK